MSSPPLSNVFLQFSLYFIGNTSLNLSQAVKIFYWLLVTSRTLQISHHFPMPRQREYLGKNNEVDGADVWIYKYISKKQTKHQLFLYRLHA
jgi:hypothetical protein